MNALFQENIPLQCITELRQYSINHRIKLYWSVQRYWCRIFTRKYDENWKYPVHLELDARFERANGRTRARRVLLQKLIKLILPLNRP